MSESKSIGWVDLTVPNAEGMRDFYAAVVGWTPKPVDMGEYADYNMTSPQTGESVAGVCHQRGVNAAIPPVWLVYFTVADLDASVAECRSRKGMVLVGPKSAGGTGRFAVIEDPAGAVCALFQPPAESSSQA